MCFQKKRWESWVKKLHFTPFLHLTNGWYHSSHEVKSAGEVPSRSDCVHTDARHVRLLVAPEEVVQVFLAQVVLLAEMLEPLRPALLRLSLLRLLQRGEDSGPTKEVDDDEQSQQQEPRVIFVYWTGAAAATAPTCHYVAVVTAVQLQWGTCGMVVSDKTHSPRRKRWQNVSTTEKSCVIQSNCCSGRLESSCSWLWIWHFAYELLCAIPSPNLSARRVLLSSSPPAALLGLGCQDAQRGAERSREPRSNLWMQRVVLLCLSKEVPTPERAFYAPRIDHQHWDEPTASIHSSPYAKSILSDVPHFSCNLPVSACKRRCESRVW